MRLFLIACGGAAGTLLRYGVSMGVYSLTGKPYFWGTLVVNAAGCFLSGLLATLFSQWAELNTEIKLMVLVGVLGGFTTFSTFSWEVVSFLREKHYVSAVGYVLGSNILGVGAAILGSWLALKCWSH